MKILLAADGSPFTASVARYLAGHLHWFAGTPEIHVLHVHAALPYPGNVAALGRGAIDKFHREESEAALAVAEKVLAEAQIPHRSTWKVGEAAERLTAYVGEHGIDLVLMGARGTGAAKSMALGSVVTQCIAALEIPVMVVRSARPARSGVTREDDYGVATPTRAVPVRLAAARVLDL